MEEIIKKTIFASVTIFLIWKLFLWQIWQLIRDDNHFYKAKKELPTLIKEYKLNHKKGEYFGSYYGQWNKHKICIEPNNSCVSIIIKISGNPQFSAIHKGISEKYLDITRIIHHMSKIIVRFIPDYPIIENKFTVFNFEDPLLDKYFQTRQLLGERGSIYVGNPGLQNAIKCFLGKNSKIVKNLVIGTEVSCSLWLGSSTGKTRLYSVTGQQVKHMLNEILPIVEELEKIINY